jgi:hypothetical protein
MLILTNDRLSKKKKKCYGGANARKTMRERLKVAPKYFKSSHLRLHRLHLGVLPRNWSWSVVAVLNMSRKALSIPIWLKPMKAPSPFMASI